MGRSKKVADWTFTWSPEEDCQEIPKPWDQYFESDQVTRALVVTERHPGGKWHIHAMFSTAKNYGSDYDWWSKDAETCGFKKPAICIKYHNNIIGGLGYLLKSKEKRILYNKNWTDEQIDAGIQQQARSERKGRVRDFLGSLHTVSPDKYVAAIAVYKSEFKCDDNRAALELAGDGFAFGRASETRKGVDVGPVYAKMYSDLQRLSRDPLRSETE